MYDLRRRALIGRHAMHEGRKGAGGFGIHIVGERAFASDRAGQALLAMDLANVATASAIATGLDDPDGPGLLAGARIRAEAAIGRPAIRSPVAER